MKQLSLLDEALPLTPRENRSYEHHAAGRNDATWDATRLFGCVCDSSWPVGLGANETQEPEFFGADCSLQHCPSGDDPMTRRDETDCHNVTAANSRYKGQRGNKCHVDCSNRGYCDYEQGLCKCYAGFYGHNCGRISALAVQVEV